MRAGAARRPATVEAGRDRVGPELAVVVDEGRQQVQPLGAPLADHVEVHELDGPALLDDRLGLAAHGLHPGGDLLGVRDGGRERDDPDLARGGG